MKEKIHIAVCLDNGYVMPTGVLMYSACVNNQDVDIDFHVLIDESVDDKGQKDLNDTINKFHGKRAVFYSLKSMTTSSFPLIKEHLTRAAYYRLFLSDILPSAIDKVLYLDGDIIVIDIPSRSINVKLSDEELAARPQQPLKRNRVVSKALRAYAQSVSSADKGGVRIIE